VVVTNFMACDAGNGYGRNEGRSHVSEKGNGLYEGSGKLESGGTWQMTITATKGGQVIASKRFSMNATEGCNH